MPDCPAQCTRRIVFLIRDLSHGGAQRQLTTLAVGMARLPGWQVTVVHFYPGMFEKTLNDAGVRTLCVGKQKRWDMLGFFRRLLVMMRELRPDVIHSYLNESNLMAVLLKPMCGFPRVVWGIRDSQTDADSWGWLGRLSFRLNRLLSVYADRIIANSQAGRVYYARQGYPMEAFSVVPNGIDTERFIPATNPGRGAVFGLVGRLHPVKDYATFFRAMVQVPEVQVRVIGSGDAAYEASLKQLAAELDLSSRITWEPTHPDMAQVYPELDCLASTSAYGEGFSNVLAEAMACGLPVLTSDVGDLAWLVGDPRYVFPPGDAGALAERMRSFLKMTQEERWAVSWRNRERILENFTVGRMVARTAALCEPPRAAGKAAPFFPRRVLWITTGLGSGGAEMMLAQLIQRLDGWQHGVISLTPGGRYAGLLQAAGAELLTLDMPAGKPSLKALLRLLRETRRLQPDLLMGWMYHGCLAAQLAGLAHGIPVVWNIRQSLYDLKLEKRGSALVIRALAALAGFPKAITYNSGVSARQHEAIGYSAGKTCLMANGIDLARWHPAAERPPGPPVIGRFGRYTAMKDFPSFLEAAALMRKKRPDLRFVLAGTDVDASNQELTARIRQLGLEDHAELLGERHDLPALTASLDLAVSSSAFGEGFPNVVAEAMACGVPVVATDIGDTARVMGGTGRLVPPHDAEALAHACLEILSLPPDERQTLGMRGREVLEKHFSLGTAVAAFDSLLHSTAKASLC